MASIQARVSRGKKYWSIVESRRINGKPRTIILAYLGTSETLLKRLQQHAHVSLKSYRHGDIRALLQIAQELGIINIINQHIPAHTSGGKQIRDGLCVGASFLLAAIGRACQPASKMAWAAWSQETSLAYCLRTSFKKLDSQHFWEQMHTLPPAAIPLIERDLVARLVQTYQIKPDCLFFDTTNFFTFIDSTNMHCSIPKRGKNKQRRYDLRQIGMGLLVTRKEQFPLFHTVYEGNKADANVFKDEFPHILKRLQEVIDDDSDITLVFDKGNNSKDNFAAIDKENCYYVAGLVCVHFKTLLKEANQHFSSLKIADEKAPIYRVKKEIWGQQRTCVITISTQLQEGQIRGIHQHLEKKYKSLDELQKKLQRPKPRTKLSEEQLISRVRQIIKGQFIEEILKYDVIKMSNGYYCFNYYLDNDAFEKVKRALLGHQIIVTNRHQWSDEDILQAYRGQSKVEYAFRNLKDPYHLAIRPQYHWTDQKIRAHFLICIIAYMLSIAVYTKVRTQTNYQHNMQHLMNDLGTIRLACIARGKSTKLTFQLEKIPQHLKPVCKALAISEDNIRSSLDLQLPVTTD